jgi:hypothetical protein
MTSQAAGDLLEKIERKELDTHSTAPVANLAVSVQIAAALYEGWISTRRMARALGTTIEDLDATFELHALEFRTGF